MIIKFIGTRINFTISIQISIHYITSTPISPQFALSPIGQTGDMSIHFLLRFCNTNSFITPYLTCQVTGSIGADCQVGIRITQNFRLRIRQQESSTISQTILQPILPGQTEFKSVSFQVCIICFRYICPQNLR